MKDVQFRFEGVLKCSTELTGEAVEVISELIESANRDLLKRGVPRSLDRQEHGAEVESWEVSGKELRLRIRSDRYVRAHDAALRLKNALAGRLGRLKIGVRGLEVENFEITADWDLPEAPRMPELFVEKIELDDGKITLKLRLESEADLRNRLPDRILRLLEEKRERLEWRGKEEHWELLWESPERPTFFDKDPTQEMERRGWIRHGAARGQWIYGPQVTKIFRTFEKIIEEEILKPLGYVEMIFPKLVPWEVWKRSGHARAVYPEIYYVCTPKTRDPEFWEDIMDYFKITGEVPTHMIMERIENIGGLCYAQCPPFWVFLQGRILSDSCLPICVFDRSGTSHRYESGGIHGIERVDEFHRIELVWLGTKEQVVEHARKLEERYTYVFEEILELRWRKAWVTPWFMAQEGRLGLAERKEVGTIDFEALLPYNGKWLEFQNLSINGDKYPKGFNVKLQSRRELWSGCSGIGLERWTAVFLAQKGFDAEKWPKGFRERVGELPEVFKFV